MKALPSSSARTLRLAKQHETKNPADKLRCSAILKLRCFLAPRGSESTTIAPSRVRIGIRDTNTPLEAFPTCKGRSGKEVQLLQGMHAPRRPRHGVSKKLKTTQG